jgi:predicted permease
MIYAEGQPLPQPGQETPAHFRVVSPEYLDTMSMRMSAGRRFDHEDNAESSPVAVVSEQMARVLWTTPRDAIGKRFGIGRPGPQNPWITVIGVVGDVVAGTVKEHSRPAFYVSYRQPNTLARVLRNLVLRADGDPILLAPAVRTEIRAIDSHIAVSDVRTMLDVLGATVAQQRFETVLLSVFAAIALTLAIVGVYGVLSYTVAQRAKDIGIRMALGAARAHVMRIVVWHSVRLATIGVLLGLCGAFATSRALKSLVFGLSTTDAVTYATVSLALVAVATVAAFVPVRRAMRIDPAAALRLE